MTLKNRLNNLFLETDYFVLEGFSKVVAEGSNADYEIVSDYYSISFTIDNKKYIHLELKIGDDFYLKDIYDYNEYLREFSNNMDVLYTIIEMYKNRDM